MTICDFHSGMVVEMVVSILSEMVLSALWRILICGAICRLTTLTRSRSSRRLAKRSSLSLKSLSTCALIGSLLAWTSASMEGSVLAWKSARAFLPAAT